MHVVYDDVPSDEKYELDKKRYCYESGYKRHFWSTIYSPNQRGFHIEGMV